MTEKIKLSKAAKEIIKNLRKEKANLKLEVETLDSKLHYSNEMLEESKDTIKELKQDSKDKEMFRKGFSVLLAAVEEKRLAWSLAEAYDNQKAKHETNIGGHNMLNDLLDTGKAFDEVKLNLDDIFKNFGLGNNKK